MAIYKDDVDVPIRVDCNVDLTSTTVNELKVRKPQSYTEVTWDATVNGEYLEYTTVDGDLDEVGVYRVQPYIESSTYPEGVRADTVIFTVLGHYRP